MLVHILDHALLWLNVFVLGAFILACLKMGENARGQPQAHWAIRTVFLLALFGACALIVELLGSRQVPGLWTTLFHAAIAAMFVITAFFPTTFASRADAPSGRLVSR